MLHNTGFQKWSTSVNSKSYHHPWNAAVCPPENNPLAMEDPWWIGISLARTWSLNIYHGRVGDNLRQLWNTRVCTHDHVLSTKLHISVIYIKTHTYIYISIHMCHTCIDMDSHYTTSHCITSHHITLHIIHYSVSLSTLRATWRNIFMHENHKKHQ